MGQPHLRRRFVLTLEYLRADTLRMKRAVAHRREVDGASIHGCLGV